MTVPLRIVALVSSLLLLYLAAELGHLADDFSTQLNGGIPSSTFVNALVAILLLPELLICVWFLLPDRPLKDDVSTSAVRKIATNKVAYSACIVSWLGFSYGFLEEPFFQTNEYHWNLWLVLPIVGIALCLSLLYRCSENTIQRNIIEEM